MRSIIRQTAIAVGMAASLLGMGALGEARAQEPIKVTIGWAPPDITGVFKTATNFFEKSAQDAKAHGFDVEVITRAPTSHLAFAEQVAIIEDFIQRRVDVIAVSPSEVQTVRSALAAAGEAGIPVIVVNLLEPIEGLDIASYIGFDNTQGGMVSAYSVADYFGGPGVLGTGEKVEVKPGDYLDLEFWQKTYADLPEAERAEVAAKGVIIEGVAGGFFSTARLNGFHEVMKQFPNVEILGNPCAADWNREKAVRCTEDFLQSTGQDLDFIWAASNEMGLGAMLALGNADRLQMADQPHESGSGKVAVFTNDVTPESVDQIANNRLIAETTHGFADWGWFGTKFAVQLACQEEVPAKFDIRPRTVYVDNAREFYPDPKLPDIDWDTIRANCKKTG
jgi:ribose transport system substrate-binding protein